MTPRQALAYRTPLLGGEKIMPASLVAIDEVARYRMNVVERVSILAVDT